MQVSFPFFPRLGIHGYGRLEPLLLAALVCEDPLLLIGQAGTGKTFLLNRIAAALGLQHRHYNASLVSFDDLVGFPYPDAAAGTVSFLQTPATLWQAESVLVDEISRCRPEVQNKFFSIIHERRLQGISISGLRYRWAAMNPPADFDTNEGDSYAGSEPLDAALADRFGFILTVPDWADLSAWEQEAIVEQGAEEPITFCDVFHTRLVSWQKSFAEAIAHPDANMVRYARIACSLLTDAGWRISPRRARQIVRNLTAMQVVATATQPAHGMQQKALFRHTLLNSLPHPAYREAPPIHLIDATHAEAWKLATEADAEALWISELLTMSSLAGKLEMLMKPGMNKDTLSLGLMRVIHTETPVRLAILLIAAYPLWQQGNVFTEDAQAELGRLAAPILQVEGDLKVSYNLTGWGACEQYLATLGKEATRRKQRARQLFLYLLVENHPVHNPEWLEQQLQQCFEVVRRQANGTLTQKSAA